MFRTTLAILAFLTFANQTSAQEAVFIIRHAEKELTGNDPEITQAGKERAAGWAKMLRAAKLDVVFTSDRCRTQQTGKIIAERLGLPLKVVPAADVAGVIDALQFDHEEETAFIVAHAETIPRILEGLGASNEIAIPQDQFDNLFVLSKPGSDNSKLIHLHMPR